jgi:eukaryotic-like serine/threonine-protein kinase
MLNTDRLGLLGRTIDGRYTINAMIGEGGVGAVYRAEHSRLGRTVAIKVLHQQYSHDPEALQRFFTEARAAATLGHMNIAESLDMGELADGVPYLVLEFLDGRSVADAIRYAGRLTVRRALRIARQITCGLEIAHDHEIIHRDLKSENVFLTHRDDNPEHVKILDFGVARVLGRANAPTRPGFLVGTPDFMAPEQIADPDHVDHRVDVYATGVIIHHMLTGRLPHGDDAPISTLLHRILHEPPAPLPEELPAEVHRLVADAMAYDRGRRIGSMSELRDRIDELGQHLGRGSTRIPRAAGFPAGTRPNVPAPAPGGRTATASTAHGVRRRRLRMVGTFALAMSAAVAIVATLADRHRAAPVPSVAAPANRPALATGTATAMAPTAVEAPRAHPASAAVTEAEPPRPDPRAILRRVPAAPRPASSRPGTRRTPEVAPAPALAPPTKKAAMPPNTTTAASMPPAAATVVDCNPPYHYEGAKKIFKPSCL